MKLFNNNFSLYDNTKLTKSTEYVILVETFQDKKLRTIEIRVKE